MWNPNKHYGNSKTCAKIHRPVMLQFAAHQSLPCICSLLSRVEMQEQGWWASFWIQLVKIMSHRNFIHRKHAGDWNPELRAYPENPQNSAGVEKIRNTLRIINRGLTVDLMTGLPWISRRVRWDTLHVWSMGKKKKKKKAISVFELTPKRQSVMVDNSLILFQC